MPSLRGTRRSTGGSAIHTYLQDREDSILPRRLARNSILPHNQIHQDPNYHGISPSEIGTSRLPAGSAFSQDDSLPAYGSASSAASESLSDGMGERAMQRNLRLLVDIGEGGLAPTQLPPLEHGLPVLECPFKFLHCLRDFALHNEAQWIQHSLTHFKREERRGRRIERVSVIPPTSNCCCFCDETFEHPDGLRSWRDRMIHISDHHQLGHHVCTFSQTSLSLLYLH